jgi:hypothetical protein
MKEPVMRFTCFTPVRLLRRSIAAGVLLAVAAAAGMPAAWAQKTWLGGGGDNLWKTTGNFSGGLGDSFSSALVFSGSTQTSNSNNATSGTAAGITFSAGADPFTLSGNAITLSNNIINSSTSLQTINLDMALTGATRTVTMTTGGGNVTLAGALSGASNLAMAGVGTLTLSGSNTAYSGTATITSTRTLVLGSNNALGTGVLNWSQVGSLDVTSGSSITSGASVILGSTGIMPFVGSGNLAFTGTTSFASTANRSLQVNSGTLTFGTVSGTATATQFSKGGAGTLVFGGPVSSIAGMSVSQGTVLINGTVTNMTSGTIAAGATLGGSGVLSGSTRVNGNLTPGSTGGDTGLVTFDTLTLGSTSLTQIGINGSGRGTAYDAVDVSNALAYSGTLSFLMPTISSGTFNIFDMTSSSGDLTAVSGTFGSTLFNFAGPSSGVWTASLGSGTTATFTQSTGELVIVPEPATLALAGLGIGLAGFAAWRRRTRRVA